MVTKAASKPVWDFRRGVATARVLVQLGLDRGLNLDTLLRHTGIAPELVERVKLYEDTVPLFDKADIETEIRDLFKRRCDLPSGGYLIIEPTEALVSIDVNSGRFTGTGKRDPEKTILRVNLEDLGWAP